MDTQNQPDYHTQLITLAREAMEYNKNPYDSVREIGQVTRIANPAHPGHQPAGSELLPGMRQSAGQWFLNGIKVPYLLEATTTWRRESNQHSWYFAGYSAHWYDGGGWPHKLPNQTHYLKCLVEYFEEVWIGTKNFELRWNDRGYQEGDTLVLREYCPGGTVHEYDPGPNGPDKEIDYEPDYTGRECRARVTYLLDAGKLGLVAMPPRYRTPKPEPYQGPKILSQPGAIVKDDTPPAPQLFEPVRPGWVILGLELE